MSGIQTIFLRTFVLCTAGEQGFIADQNQGQYNFLNSDHKKLNKYV